MSQILGLSTVVLNNMLRNNDQECIQDKSQFTTFHKNQSRNKFLHDPKLGENQSKCIANEFLDLLPFSCLCNYSFQLKTVHSLFSVIRFAECAKVIISSEILWNILGFNP